MTKMFRSFVRPIDMRRAAAVLLAASFVALPGCTATQLDGKSSSYLIIESIRAARGDTPDEDFGVLGPPRSRVAGEASALGAEEIAGDSALSQFSTSGGAGSQYPRRDLAARRAGARAPTAKPSSYVAPRAVVRPAATE